MLATGIRRGGVTAGMSTIALIGPDGSGKTSVAQQLVATSSLPLKYIYMGTSIESSNIALPTSRLVHRFKVRQHRRALVRRGEEVPHEITLHGIEHRQDRRGRIGAVARLLRRVSEETYRQLWSWAYQLRGNVVVYDRHFLFDSLPRPSERGSKRRLTDRIHDWFLHRLYPRPDLTILLAAAPQVLYGRKQEVPVDYLTTDLEALRSKREYAKEFVEVDASESLEAVVAAVAVLIEGHFESAVAHGP